MDPRHSIETLTLRSAPRERLDAAAEEIFGLFLQRETAFGTNDSVTIGYPDPDLQSGFLDDPVAFIDTRLKAARDSGAPYGRVVVLTTYADRLHDPLVANGYRADPIDMPAGPDHTCAFSRDLSDADRTLYLEVVNEADPKIRPTFALRLLDKDAALIGGACGAVHDRNGRKYAYIATLTIADGLAPGTGTELAQHMMNLLREEGVSTAHLGTQTAAPFYEKLGFRITHRLIPALRHRTGKDGSLINHDLVMMKRDL